MSQPVSAPAEKTRKLTTPLANLFDVVLTGLFFVFFTKVAYDHTPDVSETAKKLIAAYTSIPVSVVFWMALQGFRVTLVDQVRRKGTPS